MDEYLIKTVYSYPIHVCEGFFFKSNSFIYGMNLWQSKKAPTVKKLIRVPV